MTARELLKRYAPCEEACEWMDTKDAETAWNTCERGNWMLWAAARVEVDRKKIVMAACACARLVLHLVKEGDTRPQQAIETAEAWCRGEATIQQVRNAAAAAYAAAYADAYAAADAYASDAAAYAAYAAAYAAYAYAARSNARTDMLRQCADAVRKHISAADMLAAATKE